MSVYKDKPDDFPPLAALGLEPRAQSSFGGPTVPRNMIGMGPFTHKGFGTSGMGDFRGPRPSSEDRFAQATRNLGGRGVPFPAQPMSRNPNQNSPQMQNALAGPGRPTSMRDPGGQGRRDTGRSDYGPPQVNADGWTTPATRPPPTKAGDLSKFGKIDRSAGLQFEPSSLFSKRGDKPEFASVTRASSSSNMFAMLNSSEATPDAVSVGSHTAASTHPPSRKAGIDLSSGTASPIDGPQRRRLILQPRSIPMGGKGFLREDPPSTTVISDYGEEVGAVAPSMTLEWAREKITEDVKEFFILKDLNEGERYFESLPPDFRNELIETLFHKAIDAKEWEIQLVIGLFGRAAEKGLATESQFEKGFEGDMEFLEDISVDVPQVYMTVAKLMRAAKLSESAVERCVHNPKLLVRSVY